MQHGDVATRVADVHVVPRVPIASAIVAAVRPRQWSKNLLLFIPLAFTLNLRDPGLVARAGLAFVLFCMLSSAGYLLNDVADVEADRNHPLKRLRPIAAGTLPMPLALAIGIGLSVVGLAGSFALGMSSGLVAATYLVVTASYTTWLKHIVILDIFGIAAGFVLRAVAGAVVIDVPISPWLYIAAMLGALLIALGKRRSELQTLSTGAALHRRNLEAYTLAFIDQLVVLVSGAIVMTYALYTFSAENLPRDHSMMLTLPVVLYGLFRYLFLVHSGKGGAPEDLLFRDKQLLLAVITWAALSLAILYLGFQTRA